METQAKHTPGPWHVGSGGRTILDAEGDGVAATFLPHRANASLIAAAPDLLAALEALSEAVSATGDGFDVPTTLALDAGYAAIAKVRETS